MSFDKAIVEFAVKDLQYWMTKAGRDTTEAAVTAWQAGYIAGVERAISLKEESPVEEI
jgi:hypothetical protein